MGNIALRKERRLGIERAKQKTAAPTTTTEPQKPGDANVSPFLNYGYIKTIGTGSSATVKLGKRLLDDEVIAIKVINKLALDMSGLKRVGQEIAVWENLEHPGVIQLHEVIITDSYYAFVCEYAKRGDLLEHIREHGRLKGDNAKRVCSQLVSALEYCHKQGVVHRDLKLENVLLDEHGNAKLADWGFGRF